MSGTRRVVVRGGGDLGTGVAHTLATAGYAVIVLEAERPRAVRRAASFAEAIYAGQVTVEGVRAVRAEPAASEVMRLIDGRAAAGSAGARDPLDGRSPGRAGTPGPVVPVLVDPEGRSLEWLSPAAVVDARMAKRNLGTDRAGASLTIALGPGFEAGKDADVVIETMRGPSLGRLIERGHALSDTGVPGVVGGFTSERLIRSPADGVFKHRARIGEMVSEGQEVGEVDGVAVTTSLAGLLRGLVADGLCVAAGEKLGDVDPRGAAVDPARISDKARKVGKSALEALLSKGIAPTMHPDGAVGGSTPTPHV